MIINNAQARELAKFNFDIAKGLILGGLGLAIVIPFELKVLLICVSSILAYALVKIALALLKEVY